MREHLNMPKQSKPGSKPQPKKFHQMNPSRSAWTFLARAAIRVDILPGANQPLVVAGVDG